ncbi:DoxX family protein [Opitutaceae bacterium EW11]|nr:DoxX family protein [Opitutaceae bacterium EW11]
MNRTALKRLLLPLPELSETAAAVAGGLLLLRTGAGAMIFYIHGWHKLLGGIAYLVRDTPWKLAEEVAEMHAPAPIAAAFLATGVQFICSLFLIAGLFTRINAVLLTGALAGAILQNLLAERDPQLAILYTLVVANFAVTGAGRFSLDAKWFGRPASK